MKELVLVNEMDEQIGVADERKCHSGQGILHRAFTIFVFNEEGQVLIQRRSKEKSLWPLTWETSCSGHPVVGEKAVAAAKKRLKEELGIAVALNTIGKFQYQAPFNNRVSENEICFVLTGSYSGEVRPDSHEVSEHRWIGLDELEGAIEKNPDEYAPWLIIGLDQLKGCDYIQR